MLDQHAWLDFHNTNSLKQKSADRHVAPLEHNYPDSRIVKSSLVCTPKVHINRIQLILYSYKVDNCFITSNILHSAIIIWSGSNLITDTK